MANVLDYIEWRGDLTMEASPFNEVDNLILSEFSYLDMSDIVGNKTEDEPVPLHEAVDKFFKDKNFEEMSLGLILPSAIFDMAKLMAKAPRYKDLLLWGYVSQVDRTTEYQFSAICVDIDPKTTFVSYRGTDDTIIGWKEDFNMALNHHVPSQILATKYVEAIAKATRNKLILGGHSKGGNLAIYAAANCNNRTNKKILKIYSNDGPGFSTGFLSSPGYKSIEDRTISIVPQGSIVGLLLEHTEKHTVVASSYKGVFQHDGFSWLVKGNQFIKCDHLDQESLLVNKAVTSWLANMDDNQKKQFGDSFFDILFSSDASTLEELNRDKLKLFKALSAVDPAKKKLINDKIGQLFKEGRLVLGSAMETTLKDVKEHIFNKQKDDNTKRLRH